MLRKDNIMILSGSAHMALAKDIAAHVGVELGNVELKRFSDGETRVRIHESVRGKDVYVIQPTSAPANDNLMELLLLIDTLKRASAKYINVIAPYFGYARQDRRVKVEPIAARLVADLLQAAGATRVVTMDLHAAQIQGFFSIPVDNLAGGEILVDYFRAKQLENAIVVSPDMGGVSRARAFADQLDLNLAILDKRRPEPNVSEIMNIIGNVEGKTCIMIDDMIDTAGTITHGAQALVDAGASAVYACCTHGVLSGPAIERLENSVIKEVVICDTIANFIHVPYDSRLTFTTLSTAPKIADTIMKIHERWL